jgi:L,D-transpeptidase ErfK/SrfK
VALVVAMGLSLSTRAAGELAPGAGGYLVGRVFTYVVGPRDTLRALASRYGVAVSVLATANHLTQYSLLWPGEILQIDDRHVVPQTLTNGILINIPQRLLFVFAAGHVISCYPVALGRPDWPTPTGDFEITAMQQHPPWIVPVSVQRAMSRRGEYVVAWVAPGPHNPLGRYAIFLDAPGYLIHGTDRPFSIYHFSSHGCIRLGAASIASLFNQVSTNEEVKIVYQPVSLACAPDGQVFLEVDADAYHQESDPFSALQAAAQAAHITNAIDWHRAEEVVSRAAGVARQVGQKELTVANAG